MTIQEILSGVNFAYTLGTSKRAENQQLQGNDRGLTVPYQLKTLNCALEQISNCYKIVNWNEISSKTYYFISFLPITSALLTHLDLKSEFLNKSVVHLSNYLGSIGRVTAGIATLALLYLGGKTVAIVSIVSYTVDWFANSDYCNEKIKKVITTTLFALANVHRLTSGGKFQKLLSFIDLICLIGKFAGAHFSNPLVKKTNLIDSSTLKIENMQKISLDSLELDPAHFTRETLLLSTEEVLSYDELCKILDQVLISFDSIDWNKHVNVLLRKLNGGGAIRGDRHWRDPTINPKTPDMDEKKKAIAFLREGLAISIHRLKNSAAKNRGLGTNKNQLVLQIRKGMHRDDLGDVNKDSFRTMELFCKAISTKLESSDEITKADALIRWGIEAGDYCGPAYLDILPEIYKDVAKTEVNFDAEQQILLLLSQKRNNFIDGILSNFITLFPDSVVEFKGWNSLHYRNKFANIYGRSLGINLHSVESDYASSLTDGVKVLLYPLNAYIMMPSFSMDYNKDAILNSIIEELQSKRIGIQKIQDWFGNYLIEKEGFEKNSQPYNDALMSIYDLDSKNGTDFHSEALLFMLIKMGVLGIKQAENRT